MRPALLLLILPACFLAGGEPSTQPEADADTDADSDGDVDADTDTDTDPATADDSWYVFKSSGVYTGNLATAAGVVDGVEGADLLCASAAAGAGLPGTFEAWISAPGVSAIGRVPAAAGPWVLTDGEVAFPNASGFVSTPTTDIVVDEREEPHYGRVWTGTLAGGQPSGVDCDGWTSNDLEGTVGDGEGATWTDIDDTICSSGRSLICYRAR
jgi:hypothetical protein